MRAAILTLSFAIALAPASTAAIRVQRVLDWRSGLPTSFTDQIEQDPEGFLWIASSGGVVRYDGTEMRVVAPPPSRFVPGSVSSGRPVFLGTSTSGQMRMRRPGGDDLLLDYAMYASDAALWTRTGGALRREKGGIWSPPLTLPGAEPFDRGPWQSRSASVFAASAQRLYRIAPDGNLTNIAVLHGTIGVVERPDGTLVIGCWQHDGGHIFEIRGGATREIEHSRNRLIALALRGDVLWVAYDSKLVRLAPGEPADEIGAAQGFIDGGAMLVDREGSLWVAGQRGLVQFPEPETTSWSDVFHAGGRSLTRTPDGFWFSSWSGALRGRKGAAGWTVVHEPAAHINPACVDSVGAVWTVASVGFVVFAPGHPPRRVAVAGPSYASPCATDAAGRVWFPTDDGLYVLESGDNRPRRVSGPRDREQDGDRFVVALATDAAGTIFAARDDVVWHASAASIATGGSSWSAETVSERAGITNLLGMPSGDLWAATDFAGVLRRHDGRWERIPGSRALIAPSTRGPIPSPSGGYWIVGEGNFLRVAERPDLAEGWKVEERIGVWQGMPTSGVVDVLEDDDGTLWLSTNMSLVRVPPQARRARPQPPPVALVDVAVDGRRLAIEPGRAVELPYRSNRLEVRFAALTFREPGLVRYRARLNASEVWSEPSAQPSFRFVDLPAGRYHVEVQATLDGLRWSATNAGVAFRVLRPWWRSAWFFVVLAVAVLLLLAAGTRVRIAQLLRLERQRTRIAMDLHDAIGSGLGGIRILSGLAARETTPEASRVEINARIAGVAGDLSTALDDIVGSLRPGAATLGALAAQLVERATPLFADGSTVFRTELPEPRPDVSLSLAVRRHVFLIALEALHNAARHAEARTVVLAIERKGRRLRLRVEDDGRGMPKTPDGAGVRRGLGLTSMKKRADEIGARLTVRSRPGNGTVLTLEFDAAASDRRTLDRTSSHERATTAPTRSVTPSREED